MNIPGALFIDIGSWRINIVKITRIYKSTAGDLVIHFDGNDNCLLCDKDAEAFEEAFNRFSHEV